MTDETAPAAETASPPAWYWLVVVAALLFEGVGAYLFANSLSLDPAMLPLDQRVIYEATPQWMNIAWAVAIASGVTGAIGLAMRRRFAQPMLLISLITVAVQFSGLLVDKQLRELTSEDQLLAPVIILLIAYGLWQAAKLARRRGWLR